MNIHIDIETYSDVDIKKAGAYKYALSPSFEILLIAYCVENETVKVLDLTHRRLSPSAEVPAANAHPQDASIPLVAPPQESRLLLTQGDSTQGFLQLIYDEANVLHAYNAAFEWWCINQWLKRQGLPPLPASRWRCVMAHALYCGYPAGLGMTGAAVGLPEDKRKLGVGLSLIRKFCVPHKPSKADPRERIYPSDEPEKWTLFKEYNRQDVVTEREIERRLSAWPMPETEQRLWELDAEMNARGVGVDRELVNGALYIDAQVREKLSAEAIALTGVKNPKSVKQLTKWLNEELDTDSESEITTLRKADVAELLGSELPSDKARRVLELRQLLGKSSTSKYAAMDAACCADGRVRGLLQYYGANRTGRWAGRLVQVQNLPRNYLETLDIAREIAREGDTDALEMLYGNVPDTLSQLIRTALCPPCGSYIVADYSAIEARVIAWLADESWVNDVFATHGKIYEATAAQMFGVPVERIKKGNPEYALRQKGKVATLALGYQGWTGALINMGALKMGIAEEELPDIAGRWRESNPRIVELWRTLERCALRAVKNGGIEGYGNSKGASVYFSVEGRGEQRFLTAQLPSGRKLFYAKPDIEVNDKGKEAVFYQGINQQTKKWERVGMYGGKWTENIVQAIARDCLAVTLLRLEEAGYQTVFHVHDEVVVELTPANSRELPSEALQRILDIMAEPIPWAKGLILRGAGFTCEYYQKD